jgi:hypothetical protein
LFRRKLKKIIGKLGDICWLSIIIKFFLKKNLAEKKRKEKLNL